MPRVKPCDPSHVADLCAVTIRAADNTIRQDLLASHPGESWLKAIKRDYKVRQASGDALRNWLIVFRVCDPCQWRKQDLLTCGHPGWGTVAR